MNKPPAFQFYAKDWNSSPTILSMSLHDRGIAITLMAHSWDSDEPGTLPESLLIVSRICAISMKNLRHFFEKWPQFFIQRDGKLVNKKLHEHWLNYQEISEKRRKAAEERYHANAEQKHHPASASASAPAIKEQVLTPPPVAASRAKKKFSGYSAEFERFWEAYPRKVGKYDAYKAFEAAGINGELNTVIAKITLSSKTRDWTKNEGQYIPHPATWLHRRGWEDEIQESQLTWEAQDELYRMETNVSAPAEPVSGVQYARTSVCREGLLRGIKAIQREGGG